MHSDHATDGLSVSFWSADGCIQCRAEEVYTDPTGHHDRITVRETERYDIMANQYNLKRDAAFEQTRQDSVTRAYRKIRLTLWGLINMPHECGKLSMRRGIV